MSEVSCSPSSIVGVFRQLDKDGDGKVSVGELQLCLRAIGEELADEEVELLVKSVDEDGDGLLGLCDLAKLVETMWGGGDHQEEEDRRDEDVKAAFGVYEMEGVGHITAASLRRTLSRLGNSRSEDECKVMICRFDLDGDGMLNLEEFKLMIRDG